MLKLIASDIDGTLIPYGQKTLPPELFPLIRRLGEAGILFCPASGRGRPSIRQTFGPIADELCILCENGAVVFGPGGEEAPILFKTAFPRDAALALCHDIMALPDCQVFISGERTSFVCDGDTKTFIQFLAREVNCQARAVARPEDIREDIVKISAYCPKGPEAVAAALGPKWGEWKMAVAGLVWLDFGVADKGTGIRGLCEALNIGPEEVAAFGDNWNDVGMLRSVGHPYLMANAHPDLRDMFPNQCSNVLEVVEDILNGKGKM